MKQSLLLSMVRKKTTSQSFGSILEGEGKDRIYRELKFDVGWVFQNKDLITIR